MKVTLGSISAELAPKKRSGFLLPLHHCCLAREAYPQGGTHWPRSVPFEATEICLGAESRQPCRCWNLTGKPQLRPGHPRTRLAQGRAQAVPEEAAFPSSPANPGLGGRAAAHSFWEVFQGYSVPREPASPALTQPPPPVPGQLLQKGTEKAIPGKGSFIKEKNLVISFPDLIGFLLFPLTFMSLINMPNFKK